MKTKMLFLLTFSISFSYAQINMNSMSDWKDLTALNQMNFNGKQIDLSKVNGSPLLYNDFKTGKIIEEKKGGELMEGEIRYNIYKDQFELLMENDRSKAGPVIKTNQLGFELEGERFKYFHSPSILFEKGGSPNGYLVIVDELENDGNKAQILKRYYQIYIPEQKSESSYDTGRPAELKDNTAYYLAINGDYFEIETHKRKAKNNFPKEVQSDIKKFIKKNKLKFGGSASKKEDQIRQLVNYYLEII